jgi:surfactin synthase thioesterase subunit
LHRYPVLRIPGVILNGTKTDAMFVDCAKRHNRRHKMGWGLAEGSHMFPLEHPLETAALVRQHLDRLLQQ